MSANLYQLYTTEFSTNLELQLQQRGSKLRGRVSEGTHTGAKMASPVQEMGPVALKAPAGRFAPMPRVDAEFKRRWVFPQDGELPQLIDSFDELKTIVDPKSKWVMNAANAVGRAWDDEIILAATRASYIGQDANGLSTESFDDTKFRIAPNFEASADTGLTVAKMIEARRIFRKYHVDLESDPVTIVAGSKQESDLLKQAEVASKDFNDKPVLVDGKVTRILGFDIVYSERLPIYTTNTRGVLAIAKSGMYLGMWKDMTNQISQRTDLSGIPFQLYTSVSFGATRLEQGKVLQIGCADTTGSDITP